MKDGLMIYVENKSIKVEHFAPMDTNSVSVTEPIDIPITFAGLNQTVSEGTFTYYYRRGNRFYFKSLTQKCSFDTDDESVISKLRHYGIEFKFIFQYD